MIHREALLVLQRLRCKRDPEVRLKEGCENGVLGIQCLPPRSHCMHIPLQPQRALQKMGLQPNKSGSIAVGPCLVQTKQRLQLKLGNEPLTLRATSARRKQLHIREILQQSVALCTTLAGYEGCKNLHETAEVHGTINGVLVEEP